MTSRVATPQAQAAQAELARRELARQKLIHFCCYVDPGAARPEAADPFVDNYYRSPHLELIARKIERAMDGSLWRGVPGTGKKILLITTPPGHWKSSLVSRKLPAWYVGHQLRAGRAHQVILTSYNSGLATANNAAVLELMDGQRYGNIFPDVRLSDRRRSSEEWALADEAFMACKAAGVGGGLTGYHASLAIVDDPIKDRRDANSPTVRQNLWDWWKDVLRTRLLDEGFILGIWTRWTEDDPAGRLLREKMEGRSDERVVYLRLPALAETDEQRAAAAKMGLPVDEPDLLEREPGEALWPEKESAAEHLATQRAYPITFDSLYQGRPRPPGGYVVGESQFKLLPQMPKKVRWVWGTDWAITEKEVSPTQRDPDYTVAALVGVWIPEPKDLRLVIGFVSRGQKNSHEARKLVKEAALSVERPYPIRAGQDNIDKVHFFDMQNDPAMLRFSIKNLPRKVFRGDKMTKALPWLEMVQAGKVYVVQGAWNAAFFAEVENFPNGAHDDQVDAVSVAVHELGLAGRPPRKARSMQG